MSASRAALRLQQVASHTGAPAPLRVAVIGSGNWGTAIAKIVAENTQDEALGFARQVNMWMFEETIDYEGRQRKLTEVFNERKQNVKYMKGIDCPDNLVAMSDLTKVAEVSDVYIIVIPHQFVDSICRQMLGHVSRSAVALSCIKGIHVDKDGVTLFSNVISQRLGIYCGALSGANIASEVAEEKYSETTIAFNPAHGNSFPHADQRMDTARMKSLFQRPYFRIGTIDDVAGVSLAGALKNIVAVAAGLVDGLGYGDNTKAAIMRIGLVEMLHFGKVFFGNEVRTATFFEHSCGIADLITSCSGGRNRKCAMEFVKTGKSMEQLEKELLQGQKLQGAATSKEVHELLTNRNMVGQFPLFTAVYRIVYEGESAEKLWLMLGSKS
ncbi:glycerol-3-phosphate dehydrogenase [Protomyces lactucae-debilis]|uniref:Glycerol-3-phosphate dehydrogenase [NAD(+)] n=1 Tax=Protomyces lactucae-debilis TaxID=2754530 RepID=A0A1Y2FEX2_PROLT|nr:glycerol-3-phosphate dehydrogenase [Protomyces lactucae-debilis]ORY82461.1 glycerol-3-phosphate dehydrogenase [Protomyces lactucae-debilis]